jgi:murein DD-endopeptidase MepM/ murein hydrolase activator NlpD
MNHNNKHFSETARILLIGLSLLLLQFNVPLPTNFKNSWCADICIREVGSDTRTWQNFHLLKTAAASNLKQYASLIELPENLDDYLTRPEAKSFRIVKVESRKTSTHFSWPVNGRISSGFGMRRHPVTTRRSFHNGIDIKAKRGTVIRAPEDGLIVSAGRAGLLGRMVKIKTAKGAYLYFGHMHRIKCKRGQKVSRGQVIGTVGSSGRATGPHLHFSVKLSGKYVNPMKYLPRR